MAALTINGYAVINGEIRMPRVGVWSADLKVDTLALVGIGGSVTIVSNDGVFSLVGVAYREGLYTASLTMRVIGGAGGLGPAPGGVGQNLPPKFYQGVTVGYVLTDTLTACGERLSATSDQAVLSTNLKKWTRLGGPGKRAIARLLDNIATSFRVLPDGSFWVGTDTYPPAVPTQYDLVERHYGEGRVVIGCTQPFVMPGTLLTLVRSGVTTTENVSNVVHTIKSNSVRSEVFFERSGVQS